MLMFLTILLLLSTNSWGIVKSVIDQTVMKPVKPTSVSVPNNLRKFRVRSLGDRSSLLLPFSNDLLSSANCTTPDICKTLVLCRNGGSCRFNRSVCDFDCTCLSPFSGRFCEVHLKDNSTETQVAVDDYVPNIYESVIDMNGTFPDNMAAESTSVPGQCVLVNRTSNGCPAGFPCVHGFCKLGTRIASKRSVRTLLCACDPGWVGYKCDQCCPLSCGNGTCVERNETIVCACHWGYSGAQCNDTNESMERMRNDADPSAQWSAYSIVASASSAVLLGVSVVAMLVYIWRRRMPIVLKLVHRLQRFDEHDDDPSYIYDAFVSYCGGGDESALCSTPDELFVMRKMRQKLEREASFRLCLHHRDFKPGETIANNIIRAIHRSRRTILLVSPNYVRSEWTRFEYQVAQQEMLKLRHRIVPIIFRSITHVTDIDANLQCILDSVTYLTWPESGDAADENCFWEKLMECLPSKPRGSSNVADSEINRISTIQIDRERLGDI